MIVFIFHLPWFSSTHILGFSFFKKTKKPFTHKFYLASCLHIRKGNAKMVLYIWFINACLEKWLLHLLYVNLFSALIFCVLLNQIIIINSIYLSASGKKNCYAVCILFFKLLFLLNTVYVILLWYVNYLIFSYIFFKSNKDHKAFTNFRTGISQSTFDTHCLCWEIS